MKTLEFSGKYAGHNRKKKATSKKRYRRKVYISVRGGVVDVESCPRDVDVIVEDHDLEDEE